MVYKPEIQPAGGGKFKTDAYMKSDVLPTDNAAPRGKRLIVQSGSNIVTNQKQLLNNEGVVEFWDIARQ